LGSPTVPVVTIVGEGGVGKTALALRCLYDVAQGENSKYDAVIWASLKTKTLTARGAEEIRESLISTLSLVQTIVGELGNPNPSKDLPELLEEIIGYMADFRIFLAVDNFETLTDFALRSFLSRIPVGSKVLITSRVGLGEIELRYKLDPMDIKTSAQLMRKYAKTLNVDFLSKAQQRILERYCRSLFYNPLLIKWFVSSVALGADPEKAASRSDQAFTEALKFCFENLFTRLGTTEKEVLHVLASARRQLTQTELFYLLNEVGQRNRSAIDWSLSILHSSSMLRRTLDSSGRKPESPIFYVLTDFAAEFIAKCFPPPSVLFGRVQGALKRLREMTEHSVVAAAAYKYEIRAIRADTRDQRISGAYLQRALDAARINQMDDARYLINEAKALLPNYSEPYRISGFIESSAGNLYKASEEFEDALRLDPNSSIARYSFAIFLSKYLEDNQAALEQLECALKIDPEDPSLKNAKALALMRLGRYPEATQIYEELLASLPSRRRWWIPITDQAAECYKRWAEQAEQERDDSPFAERLQRSLQILEESFASNLYDEKMAERFTKIVQAGFFYAVKTRSSDFLRHLLQKMEENKQFTGWYGFNRISFDYVKNAFSNDRDLINQLDRLTLKRDIVWHTPEDALTASDFDERPETSSSLSVAKAGDQPGAPQRLNGMVTALTAGTLYGFITASDGSRWFFHKNHLQEGANWMEFREGVKVSFSIGSNKSGPCAVDVLEQQSATA